MEEIKHCLKAEHISKNFKKKQIVSDISLSIESGQVVGLLGPNGAGKTTTFYMIVGLIAVSEGRIFINDQDITHYSIHKRAKLGLGYLPQEASIFRKMTVEENIRSILELKYSAKSKIKERLNTLLDELNINHIKKSPAFSLSGGERRRVEIARTLAIDPSFILLDEPFAGVDPLSVMDIQNIIKFLKQKNIGVLITDHNVRETFTICDYTYIINNGKKLAEGHPNELVQNEVVKKVYLGEDFKL